VTGYRVAVRVDQPGITPAARARLRRVAARALSVQHVPAQSELSVVLTNDDRIRALNREFRDTDTPTDVLSFAQQEGDAFQAPGDAPPHLGDVVISLQTAERQAREHGIAFDDELAHLLVHGILHLLGYDHERVVDARAMRAREEAILGHVHHH
jgi:probable rRNA maturation factor